MEIHRTVRNAAVGAALAAAALLVLVCGASLAQKGKPVPGTAEKIAFVSRSALSRPDGVFAMNTDGSGRTALAADRTYACDWPDWSPDLDAASPGYQGKIAYRTAAAPGSVYRIWTINPDGSGKAAVTSVADDAMSPPAWSPYGGYIAYTIGEGQQEENPNHGVWVYGPIGPGLTPGHTRIWSDANARALDLPRWTPDLDPITPGYQGKLLVVAGLPAPSATYAIDMTVSLTGQLAWDTGWPALVHTAWGVAVAQTPYGLRAAFRRWDTQMAGYAIYAASIAYDAQTGALNFGDEVRVTPSGMACSFPDWSDDGTRLAYGASTASVQPEVYSLALSEDLGNLSTPVRLTDNSLPDTVPSWSPPVF